MNTKHKDYRKYLRLQKADEQYDRIYKDLTGSYPGCFHEWKSAELFDKIYGVKYRRFSNRRFKSGLDIYVDKINTQDKSHNKRVLHRLLKTEEYESHSNNTEFRYNHRHRAWWYL